MQIKQKSGKGIAQSFNTRNPNSSENTFSDVSDQRTIQ